MAVQSIEGMNRRAISIFKKAEYHPSSFFGSLFDIRDSLFKVEPQNIQCRMTNVEGMNRSELLIFRKAAFNPSSFYGSVLNIRNSLFSFPVLNCCFDAFDKDRDQLIRFID
jgi:hypothetical protein